MPTDGANGTGAEKPQTESSKRPVIAPERRAEWFRFGITLMVLAGVFAVLWVTLSNVVTGPFLDPQGSIVDPFSRANSIVSVVLPFITLTLGYWFGSKGTENANEQAAVAQEQAARGVEQAAQAHARATVLAMAVDPAKANEIMKDNADLFKTA